VGRSASVRLAEVSAREALRGLVAFLLMVATLAGVTAGLLYAGERPGPPPAWPRWEDVFHFLGATEPPLSGLRYVVSMAGWLLLAYVGAVLLMRAMAGTLVTLTRGAAWAHDLERLADLVTLPWIKRAASGGLMAALLVASLVRVSPELPRPASGHGESAVRVVAPALDMPAAWTWRKRSQGGGSCPGHACGTRSGGRDRLGEGGLGGRLPGGGSSSCAARRLRGGNSHPGGNFDICGQAVSCWGDGPGAGTGAAGAAGACGEPSGRGEAA